MAMIYCSSNTNRIRIELLYKEGECLLKSVYTAIEPCVKCVYSLHISDYFRKAYTKAPLRQW